MLPAAGNGAVIATSPSGGPISSPAAENGAVSAATSSTGPTALGSIENDALGVGLRTVRLTERPSKKRPFSGHGGPTRLSTAISRVADGRVPSNLPCFDGHRLLVSLATLHGLPSQDRFLNALRHAVTTHFASGACGLSIGCQSVVSEMFPRPPEALTQEDFQQMLQIRLSSHLQPRLSRAVARRILTLHNVEFSMQDGPAKLRSLLGKYLKSLDSKRPCYESKQAKRDRKTEARTRESNKLKDEWPQLVSPSLKEKFKTYFNQLISKEALSAFTCGSCIERYEEMEQNNPPPRPWLDPGVIPPPMPVKSGAYSSLLVDPQCIEDDPDSMEPVLVVCKTCRSELKRGIVPRRAMANHNFLGPVPPELQDLTVVEQAMIARCRSKCWIIQLREDDDSGLPNIQRGFKGHIIVYPQQPTKAKPLIVHKEKVMNALDWLATHNHLYKDVVIDRTVFYGHGETVNIPFHIEHILPSDGIEATTSSYSGIPRPLTEPVLTQTAATSDESSYAHIRNIRADSEPRPTDIPFESVVVTDVKGHESSSVLRKAATRHLEKLGGNYLELRHDPQPVNEFNNPDLFPLISPTLFPYGIGGVEDKLNRGTRFGFQAHLKHFFNLADRRFQEHYSFLFTAFNMLQRETLLLHTSFKVNRQNFDTHQPFDILVAEL
ncbi:hypothetical protein B0H13DRAFT_1865650 [Mycena leptocephala]|nr:hypothetical protein B0H13DRAFT_1865650 [Mycena leptocephala]